MAVEAQRLRKRRRRIRHPPGRARGAGARARSIALRFMQASPERIVLLSRNGGCPRWRPAPPFDAGHLPCYSLLSRFMPSMSGCHPYTIEIMKPSMRRSPGWLSFTVDL